jgi:hypothetical protein
VVRSLTGGWLKVGADDIGREAVYVRSCLLEREMTNVRVSDDDVDEVRGDLIGPTTHQLLSRPAEGDRPSVGRISLFWR